jgi:hypothetical protein
VGFLERLLVLSAATGPGMTRDKYRGVSPCALLLTLLPIGGRELNFKRMNLTQLRIR